MPGIHVYKNVLKDCKKIIKCFEDNEDSLLSDWEQWETQGYKKGFSINEKNLFLKKNDSKKIKKQKKYINKINKCLEIVFNDYVSFYLNENVPWPENVNINKLQILNDYYMGFYKYDVKHMLKDDFKKIAMRYHVDDITGKGGLTFTYYLNDNYDGGEICFYNKNDSKIYQ